MIFIILRFLTQLNLEEQDWLFIPILRFREDPTLIKLVISFLHNCSIFEDEKQSAAGDRQHRGNEHNMSSAIINPISWYFIKYPSPQYNCQECPSRESRIRHNFPYHFRMIESMTSNNTNN